MMDCDSYYKLIGSGPIKLLFIAGLGGNMHYWYYQINYFQKFKNYQICVFNNRGSHDVMHNSQTMQINDMVEDVKNLLEKIEWESANIIGISMGGMCALKFAALYPNMCDSLILINTSDNGKNVLLSRHAYYNLIQHTTESMKESLWNWWLNKNNMMDCKSSIHSKMMFTKKFKLTNEYKNMDFNKMAQLSAIIRFQLTTEEFKIIENIPRIILCGTQDKVIHCKYSFQLQEKLKCKLFQFNHCGHGLNIDSKNMCNTIIRTFTILNFTKKKAQNKYNHKKNNITQLQHKKINTIQSQHKKLT